MREIKFRAKGVDGQWKYGSIVAPRAADRDHVFSLQRFFQYLRETQMDIETLGEYTGLKDKSGKEIYEGDIIEVTEGKSKYRSEVVFVGTSFCLVNRKCCKHCAEGTGCIGSLDELMGEYKVIGNVYEHGELLEASA